MQKRQKKFKKGMVGHQNAPIHIKWAAKVSTLRTTALELLKAVCKYIFVQEGAPCIPLALAKTPIEVHHAHQPHIAVFKSGLNFFFHLGMAILQKSPHFSRFLTY